MDAASLTPAADFSAALSTVFSTDVSAFFAASAAVLPASFTASLAEVAASLTASAALSAESRTAAVEESLTRPSLRRTSAVDVPTAGFRPGWARMR